jgi:hypothetical protein
VKSRIFKIAIFFIAFLVQSAQLMADALCDPISGLDEFGFPCDEDLPLDTHIWVLILVVAIFTITLLRKKQPIAIAA